MNDVGQVSTRSLRAAFFKFEQRIGHRIEIKVDGEFAAVLVSCEGAEQDAWPPSPPLQSLHIEQHGADQVAFLVGMAGRSHWSASVKASTAANQLEFEIACRTAEAPARLGCAYEREISVDQAAQIYPQLAVEAAPPLQLTTTASGLNLSFPSPKEPKPQTMIWRYYVRLQQPSPA